MRGVVNKIISKIKGAPFVFDAAIPSYYIFRLFFSKIFCGLFGILVFRRCTRVFFHRTSTVKCRSKIRFGRNLSIDRYCYIDALSTDGIVFGENVSIGKYTTIECTGTLTNIGKGLVVGSRTGLGTHGFFGCAGGVVIGSDTIFGNYVSIHSENHNFNELSIPIRCQGVNRKGIVIGNNCWIGAKATILDGSKIGNGCVIAAGAVVIGEFPDNSVVGGVPAKIIKYRNDQSGFHTLAE